MTIGRIDPPLKKGENHTMPWLDCWRIFCILSLLKCFKCRYLNHINKFSSYSDQTLNAGEMRETMAYARQLPMWRQAGGQSKMREPPAEPSAECGRLGNFGNIYYILLVSCAADMEVNTNMFFSLKRVHMNMLVEPLNTDILGWRSKLTVLESWLYYRGSW